MRSLLILVVVLVLAAAGVAGVVAGEADDSPGLQGLGVLLVVGSALLGARRIRRTRRPPAT